MEQVARSKDQKTRSKEQRARSKEHGTRSKEQVENDKIEQKNGFVVVWESKDQRARSQEQGVSKVGKHIVKTRLCCSLREFLFDRFDQGLVLQGIP